MIINIILILNVILITIINNKSRKKYITIE